MKLINKILIKIHTKKSHPSDLNNSLHKYLMCAHEIYLPKIPESTVNLKDYLGIPYDTCPYCIKPIKGKGTIDEIVPCMEGGRYSNDLTHINLVKTCQKCNNSKGSKYGYDFIIWVEDGGFAKDPTKKIPEEYREKIKIWYLENIIDLETKHPAIQCRIKEIKDLTKDFFDKQYKRAETICPEFL